MSVQYRAHIYWHTPGTFAEGFALRNVIIAIPFEMDEEDDAGAYLAGEKIAGALGAEFSHSERTE